MSIYFHVFFTAREHETERSSSKTVVMSVDQPNSSCQGSNSEFSNHEETKLVRK